MSAAIAFALATAAAAPSSRTAEISAVEIRLFDPDTGGFLDNLLNDELHGLALEVIGGHDVLIKVGIIQRGPGPYQAYFEEPIEVTASAGDRVLAKRRLSGLRMSAPGPTWVPLWLSGLHCGQVNIVARVGTQSRTATMHIMCAPE